MCSSDLARFGRYLSVALHGTAPAVAGLLREHPARVEQTDEGDLVQGLAVRVRVERPQAVGEVELGERGRFWPTNEALAAWKALAGEGQARIVYEVESR